MRTCTLTIFVCVQLLDHINAAFATLIFLASVSVQASLPPSSCFAELDGAVNLYNKGNTSAAETRLKQLANSCSQLPQVHHNLGVIASMRQQWQQATEHFQRAVASDLRTNITYSHLQALHEYKATIAYRTALGVKGKVSQPLMSMQNSTLVNAAYEAPLTTELHTVPSVDYELYSWWTAAATDAMPAWLEHYVAGYPPLENTDARIVNWGDVGRNISFTAQDAVVVLSYRMNEAEKRTLLLLRLQNNRWKIYRESAL